MEKSGRLESIYLHSMILEPTSDASVIHQFAIIFQYNMAHVQICDQLQGMQQSKRVSFQN